jgi:hypothetical protein
MTTLRRLVGPPRLSKVGVSSPITLVARGICHRTVQPRLYASRTPVVDSSATLENIFLRGYATTTKKKPGPKKTTTRKPTTKKTTKKTAAKKTAAKKKKPAAKKAKPKKKAVKKVIKKKKAKKPVKPVRPKVTPLPSPRALSGFVVYLQNELKSSTGPDAAGRLKTAVASWKSLSDAEQEVHLFQYIVDIDLQNPRNNDQRDS